MMLIGRHNLSVSRSDSLIFPRELRKMFHGRFFVTRGFDQNLILFSGESFEKVMESFAHMSLTDPNVRLLSRMIMGSAVEVLVDQSGRLELPGHLFKALEARELAVVIGQGAYCEIWASELWEKQEQTLQAAAQDAARFSSFQLCTA